MSNSYKCPKCGSDTTWDKISQTYYCERCNSIIELEDMEYAETSLIVLLAGIPIINFIVYPLIKDREVKKLYVNALLAWIISFIFLLAVIAFILFLNREATYESMIKLKSHTNVSIQHRDIELPIYSINLVKEVRETEPIVEEKRSITELEYLNDSLVIGSTLKDIIKFYPEETFLLQTYDIQLKYRVGVYYQFGYTLKECKEYSTELTTKVYDSNIEVTFTRDGNYINPADLFDKTGGPYVWTIYDASYFKIHFITDTKGNIIGLQMEEVNF